jgi:hypothetical protein
MAGMSKRVAAAILWFFAAWYLGAFIALLLGVSEILGPILGITAAVLFAGDPLGVIWTERATAAVDESMPERIEELAEAA